MTLPGVLQAVLIVICTVGSFQLYFERPGQVFVNIIIGLFFFGLGILMISLNWFAPGSLDEIWNFQAKDFYQGTIIFSLGVGLVIGNFSAWVFSIIKEKLN